MTWLSCAQRTLVAKTCRGCGELKLAKHFSTVTMKSGRYRNSQCHDCNNATGKVVMKHHQRKAVKGAVKHAQPWSEEDIKRLDELTADRVPAAEIAIELNRTVYSIYTMRNKLRKESA